MVDLNIIWVVGCSGLVLMMQPGFMCLESGLTRSKNSINVAVKNLADLGISICSFWTSGFALMFGASLGGFIGTSGFFLNIEQDPKLAAFFVFQMMFCGTATTITSGALAERLRFKGYLAIAFLISGLIYPVFGHWVWNGVGSGERLGWLAKAGFLDFAGSTVVHSVGGWVSLAALLVIGPRIGRFNGGDAKIHGSNLPFSVLGTMLLWVGWLGFNGGSTFELTNQIPGIMVHTVMAGAAGMVAAAALGWKQEAIVQPETLINGSLAGLVSITAGCNVLSTPMAVLTGAIGGLIMVLATDLIKRQGIDDGVDAVAIHGFAGAWGTLAVALFGNLDLMATGLTRHQQLLAQLAGVGVAFVWSFGLTYLLLKTLDRFSPLRVSPEEEELGLNVSEHNAKTETYDLFEVMEQQARSQDFSLRVPEQPFTTVGKIARAYNKVMAATERSAQQLKDLNERLEQTVDERTAELLSANSQLTEANQQLERLDKLKDEFLSNTSHELRTPLNGIIGLSEYLMEGTVGNMPEQAKVNLAMIARSGRRLYNLVNDILDFSNVLHDNMRLQLKAVGLREVVEIVLTLCRPLIGSKQLRVVNGVPADFSLLWTDEDRLQQILYNLVGNAVKFTHEGVVEVRAETLVEGFEDEATSLVRVTVADTGIGVSPDKYDSIFESFEQAEGTTARAYGGLGLGLAVTKKLVEIQGGKIWVESVENEGSQFHFTLPVYGSDAQKVLPESFVEDSLVTVSAEGKTEAIETSVVSSAIAAGVDISLESVASEYSPARKFDEDADVKNSDYQILIVDDDPVNLQVLNNYLGLRRYRVTRASSGHDALALLDSGYDPDLVILDVMMPRMTGYEVTEYIRAQWERHELPIVLLTAKNRLEDEVVGLAAGANDYLTKPIVKEGLLARIETQLTLRQESRGRQQAQIELVQFAKELEEKNIALLMAKDELAQQNHTLEQQVATRTVVLAESERKLSTLLKNLPGMAYRSENNSNWPMVFASEGCLALTGYPAKDLVEHAVLYGDLIHPDDRAMVWETAQTALSSHQTQQLTYRLLLPETGVKWVWEQYQPVLGDENSETVFFEGFITDISDRIRSQNALEQSNQELQQLVEEIQSTQAELEIAKEKSEAASKAKSEFLANMSHELRTPLNSVIGFAQLLERDAALQPKQQQRAHTIGRSAEHLLSLINGILDISKIEARKVTLDEVDFDLYDLLKDVLGLFDLEAKRKNIRLELQRDADVPQFVFADAGKLRQILINLIANGVKFTDKGHVVISVASLTVENAQVAHTHRLFFGVRDTGKGIAASELERLFVPFEQAAAGREMKQGTGLGLSISQQYCQLMGGKISVRSAMNAGSSFKFTIPVRRSERAICEHRGSGRVIGLAAGQPDYRILVAGDLSAGLTMLSDWLRSAGFMVEQASSGEAIAAWQFGRPHLIFMDLRASVANGHETIREVRARQRVDLPGMRIADETFESQILSPAPIIVALTEPEVKASREAIAAAGFDDFMAKPVEPAAVWQMLARHLGAAFTYETAAEREQPTAQTIDGNLASGMDRDWLLAQLSVMPADWLVELCEAANQIKGKRVLQLLERLPLAQVKMAKQLRYLAENYQFEQIVEVIEQIPKLR